MILKISIEKGEDGFFVASVPSLKGCWSQGKTREEALENIREAIELYLEPDEIETAKRGREIVELAIRLHYSNNGESNARRIIANRFC
ncbi:MAG: type II toxin-antitoxin system HicB family antitoxin [Pyrinomonadaceae bacterium]